MEDKERHSLDNLTLYDSCESSDKFNPAHLLSGIPYILFAKLDCPLMPDSEMLSIHLSRICPGTTVYALKVLPSQSYYFQASNTVDFSRKELYFRLQV